MRPHHALLLTLSACTATPTDAVDTDVIDSDPADTDPADTDPGDTDGQDTDAGTPCTWTATSTLAGATITGGDVPCTWTLSEADAGVDVPFTLTITEAVDVRVDMVSCAGIDDSGLRFDTLVSPSGTKAEQDLWCPRCDVGLCPTDTATYTTAIGTWPDTFTWRPRRWEGPSDFGQQPGALFPAGTYTLVVMASGTTVSGDTPWTVALTTEVSLTE